MAGGACVTGGMHAGRYVCQGECVVGSYMTGGAWQGEHVL